jgi:iron complex transport system ATP-binding protein
MHAGSVIAHGAPTEVMTAETIRRAFGLASLVMPDPLTGTPIIIPVPSASASARRRRHPCTSLRKEDP